MIGFKFAFFFLVFALGFNFASAKDTPEDTEAILNPKRPSSLNVGIAGGESRYRELYLGANFGIDSSLLLRARLLGVKNGEDSKSGDFRVGADYKITDPFSVRSNFIFKTEPNQIKGRGLHVGVSYDLNSLWESKVITSLFLDYEAIRFRQGDTTSKPTRRQRLMNSVLQKSATIGITQEIAKPLLLTLSLSRYRYSQDPTELVNAVDVRRIPFPGVQGLVEGFPKTSASLYFDVFFLETWSANLGFSRAVFATSSQVSKNTSLGLSNRFSNDLALGISSTASKTDDSKPFLTLGLNLSYFW